MSIVRYYFLQYLKYDPTIHFEIKWQNTFVKCEICIGDHKIAKNKWIMCCCCCSNCFLSCFILSFSSKSIFITARIFKMMEFHLFLLYVEREISNSNRSIWPCTAKTKDDYKNLLLHFKPTVNCKLLNRWWQRCSVFSMNHLIWSCELYMQCQIVNSFNTFIALLLFKIALLLISALIT